MAMAKRTEYPSREKQIKDYPTNHLKYNSQYYQNPTFDTLDFGEGGSTDSLKNEKRNERKHRMDIHNSQVAEAAGTLTHVKESDTSCKTDDNKRIQGGRAAVGRRNIQSASILYSANADRPPKSRTSKQFGTVRNVVYYQNRFIILDPPEAKSRSNTSSDRSSELLQPHEAEQPTTDDKVRKSQTRNSASGEDVDDIPEKFRHLIKARVSSDALAKETNMEMDASSVTMDARGIEIIVTDSDSGFKSRSRETNKTMWKRISRILLDNRMKGRDGSGRVIHSEQTDEYRVLKKVLNIVFLTIGITLLISVIIVIIYTAVVGDPPSEQEP